MDAKNKERAEPTGLINEEDKMFYENKMKNFECPFTWQMNEQKYSKTEYNPHDDEEFIPLMKLMRSIVHLYEDTKKNEDSEMILENLKKCEDSLIELSKRAHSEIAIEAARYILQATKSFVYLEMKMETELKKLLAEMEKIDSSNKKQISTLKACKSIAWSNYRRSGAEEAEKSIREAIKENPNCDLWHFILGKMLRRKRRDAQYNSKPKREETERFLKAYEMAKNPVYGIFLAQVYREQRDLVKSEMMYERVFREKPESNTLLLRMALGFIGLKNFYRAKTCLDLVAKECSTHSMYLHYQGLYHMKRNQYQEASVFFKQAIKDKNLPAEYTYVQCMKKIDDKFNVTQHFQQMSDRYKNCPEEQLQSIILQLAFSYWIKDMNIQQSLKYFLEAIEMNPKAKCLTNFFSENVQRINERNIFRLLERDILPLVHREPSRFDKKTIEMERTLKEYCDKHFNAEFEVTQHFLHNLRFRN